MSSLNRHLVALALSLAVGSGDPARVWGAALPSGTDGEGRRQGASTSPSEAASARVPVILDTDIGTDIDDAFALALVLASPELDLLGVTTVSDDAHGRALIACRFLDAAGRNDVPVAAGRPRREIPSVVGQYQYGRSAGRKQPVPELAVEFLYRQLKSRPGEITIITIGDQTNVGDLLTRHPETKLWIRRVVMMGGSVRVGYGGQPPPEREWNIRSDVKSTQILFRSGTPLVVAPLDATLVRFPEPLRRRVFETPNALGRELWSLYRLWGKQTPTLFDPVAVTLAFNESFVTMEQLRIEVDDRGFTREVPGEANCRVAMGIRAGAFLEWYVERIVGLAERAAEPSDELAKWDNAGAHRSSTGPGGTEWDAPYRSFIQTDESAASKGLPTHAEAAAAILADAARNSESLHRHQAWVLYIKHFSQSYRPDSATTDLRRLYEKLVALHLNAIATVTGMPLEEERRLTIHRDVVYGRSHPEIQKLDAYLVKSAQPTPVVIEIHGGGWRRGSKSQFIYPGDLIRGILDTGMAVISIDYRLTPQHTMPAQTEDVTRAVQFVRSRAKEWNLDPNRIATLGGSAGAHLAAWVALHDDVAKPDSPDPVERASSRLACFVALSGPMDLTRVRPTELARQPLRGQDFANAFTAAFGCTAEQFETDATVRQRIHEASPVFLVTPGDPPGFLLGAWSADLGVLRDPPVPAVINDPHSAWHSVLLAEAMRKAGAMTTCRLGPEVGRDPITDNAAILRFLRENL